MYATTAGQGLGRVVGVALVVILAAAAGTAVGTVLRDQFRTEPGAPIDAVTSRTATAAFSLDAIADLHALRAAGNAVTERHATPDGGQRKAADPPLARWAQAVAPDRHERR